VVATVDFPSVDFANFGFANVDLANPAILKEDYSEAHSKLDSIDYFPNYKDPYKKASLDTDYKGNSQVVFVPHSSIPLLLRHSSYSTFSRLGVDYIDW